MPDDYKAPPQAAKDLSVCPKSCAFYREGLLVYPVRYAVLPTPSFSGLAPLAAPFQPPAIALESAGYGLRGLRPGYLYVYRELIQKLQGYRVTPHGLLWEMPLHLSTEAKPPMRIRPPLDRIGLPTCSRALEHMGLARALRIPQAEEAGAIWLAYSDVEWTTATEQAQSDPATRQQHMRRIDISAAAAGKPGAHCANLRVLSQAVAEAALPSAGQRFEFSNAPYAGLPPESLRALHRVSDRDAGGETGSGKGIVVALDDPSGVLQDLTGLIAERTEAFNNRDEFKRELHLEAVVRQLETQVTEQADEEIWQARHQLARGPLAAKIGDGYRAPTEAELIARRQLRLAQYQQPIKAKREAFLKQYNSALSAFQAQEIEPLYKAHLAWLQSRQTGSYYACNFDTANPRSGVAYLSAALAHTAGTLGYQPAAHYYGALLAGAVNSPDRFRPNFLLRALVLNQDVLAEKIDTAAKSALEWAEQPWPDLIGAFKNAADELMAPDLADSRMAAFIGLFAVPFGKVYDKAFSSNRVYQSLLALGAITGKPLVRVALTGGTVPDLTQAILRQLAPLTGYHPQTEKLQRAIRQKVDRMAQMGLLHREGPQHFSGVLHIDPAQLAQQHRQAGAAAPLSERSRAIAGLIHTADQLPDTGRLRLLQAGTASKGHAFGTTLMALAMVVQNEAINSAIDKGGKAELKLTEANWKLAMQRLALTGLTLEFVEQTVKTGMSMKLPPGTVIQVPEAIGTLGTVGNRLGVLAGLGLAAVDIRKSYIEARSGDMQDAILYGFNGFLGGAAAFVMLAPVTTTGVVLFVACLGMNFLVSQFGDDPILDWLEKTCWVRGTYKSHDEDVRALRDLV